MRASDIAGGSRQGSGFALALALAIALLVPTSALAAGITVTTTTDRVDGNTASFLALGATPGADGKVSLREAVIASRGELVTGDITLTNGSYVLESSATTVSVGVLPEVAGGSLDISKSVRINGAASTISPKLPTTVNARIFDVDPAMTGGVVFELSNTTLTQGYALGPVGGGAIRAGGAPAIDTVTLTNCALSNNRSTDATASSGGALSIGRNVVLALDRCSFSNNTAKGVGGAVFVADSGSGRLTVQSCTFTGNTSNPGFFSAGQGGAIYARVGSGNGFIRSSTFTTNTATSSGVCGPDRAGALFIGSDTQFEISGNRIVNNVADQEAGLFGFLGNPDAEYNWWARNTSPASAPALTGGVVDIDPWLRLTLASSPSTVTRGGSCDLNASVSQGGYFPPADGAAITFGSDSLGWVPSPSTVLGGSGTASKTYTALSICGPSVANVTYDGVVATAHVGILGEPELYAASEITFTVGGVGSFTVNSKGYPIPRMALEGTRPAGISFTYTGAVGATTSAGTISGMPLAGSGGRYPVSLVASNGVSPDASKTLFINVIQRPSITSALTTSFTVGAPVSFGIVSTGYPAAAIGALDPLPTGVALVDHGNGTASITGTPSAGAGGIWSVRITADNALSTPDTRVLTITVYEAPSFTSTGWAGFVEGVSGSFDVTTYGYPKPAIGRVGALPPGLSFTDYGTGWGAVLGTPNAGAAGCYYVQLTLTSIAGSAVQTLTLDVDGPPGADADEGACFEDGQAFVNVLDGDSDPNGDPLTAELVGLPSSGDVTLSPSGVATYTPDADFNGTDTFTYRAKGEGPFSTLYSAPTTVTVTVTAVNDAPSFTDGGDVTVDEDSGVHSGAWAGAISAGPANESAQALDFSVSNDNPALFSAAPEVASDGTLSFTPAENANGSAEVTVTLTDDDTAGGAALSHVETLTVTVTAVNDAPVASDDATTTAEDTAITVPAPGAIGNDSDIEDDSLTATSPSDPANGTVILQADGGLTYTPDADFSGTDTFTYRAYDGAAYSAPAIVTVTVTPVNDAPAFTDGGDVTVAEDSGAHSAAWAGAISAGPANESAQALDFETSNNNPALFSAAPAVASDGRLSFTPASNANGSALVTVTLTDDDTAGGAARTHVETVTITVTAVNDAPSASNDSATTDEDTVLAVLAPGLLGNDADIEGAIWPVLAGAPSNGTVTLAFNGAFTYTPNPNFNGTDSFTYRAFDGAAASAPTIVRIRVTPVNDAPTFTDGRDVTVDEDSGVYSAAWADAITAGPANESGQHLAFVTTNSAPALFAAAPVVSTEGTLTFTPAADATGSAEVTVTLTDDATQGGSARTHVETLTITVTPIAEETTLSITSGSTTLAAYGRSHVVTGQLTAAGEGLPDRIIILQSSTTATGFADTALVATTTADGSFEITVTPRSRTYYRARFAGEDRVYAVALSGSIRVLPRALVTRPIAPRMHSRKKATISGTIKPRHKSGTKPVRVYKYRLVKGKWKSYGYVLARVSDSAAGSKYKASVSLPYSGVWRLRAYSSADAGHASSWSGYTPVRVRKR